MALGGGIRSGRLDRAVSIMDLAPTFCELLGVTLPGAEGAPIGKIVACSRDTQADLDPSRAGRGSAASR